MAKQLLVVFGATGNQGGSVANAVFDNTELSQRYSVRAITRSIDNPKAQALKSRGAELVAADLDDPSSLPAALKGADFVYAVTSTDYERGPRVTETRQAKALVDEAVKQGVKYIIWSTLSSPAKISDGKLKNAEHFDVKAEIEDYIRGLPVKSAFFAPGSFMQNFFTNQMPRPSYTNDGSFMLANLLAPTTKVPLIDITNTGAWVAAILAEPEKYEGKVLAASEGLYTMEEVVQIMSKVTGKTVTYSQLPDEMVKGFLPEPMKEQLFEMFLLQRDYGYFGKDTAEQVEWAKKQTIGKLNGVEEFLVKNGFKL